MAACNRNFTALQGRIKTFDLDICEFYIIAPTSYKISIHILSVYYPYDNCSTNGLQVSFQFAILWSVPLQKRENKI